MAVDGLTPQAYHPESQGNVDLLPCVGRIQCRPLLHVRERGGVLDVIGTTGNGVEHRLRRLSLDQEPVIAQFVEAHAAIDLVGRHVS
jgi:hypothetical protein